MMRFLMAAVIVAYLISCSPPEGEPPPDPNAAAQVGEAHPLPRTLPTPTPERPRYVGLWAASENGCAEPAWRWEAQRVTTQGEVSCDFTSVQLTSTGYTIQATCTAEGPPTPQQIQLSFAESARAMLVDGGPWTPLGLVYCGPLE